MSENNRSQPKNGNKGKKLSRDERRAAIVAALRADRVPVEQGEIRKPEGEVVTSDDVRAGGDQLRDDIKTQIDRPVPGADNPNASAAERAALDERERLAKELGEAYGPIITATESGESEIIRTSAAALPESDQGQVTKVIDAKSGTVEGNPYESGWTFTRDMTHIFATRELPDGTRLRAILSAGIEPVEDSVLWKDSLECVAADGTVVPFPPEHQAKTGLIFDAVSAALAKDPRGGEWVDDIEKNLTPKAEVRASVEAVLPSSGTGDAAGRTQAPEAEGGATISKSGAVGAEAAVVEKQKIDLAIENWKPQWGIHREVGDDKSARIQVWLTHGPDELNFLISCEVRQDTPLDATLPIKLGNGRKLDEEQSRRIEEKARVALIQAIQEAQGAQMGERRSAATTREEGRWDFTGKGDRGDIFFAATTIGGQSLEGEIRLQPNGDLTVGSIKRVVGRTRERLDMSDPVYQEASAALLAAAQVRKDKKQRPFNDIPEPTAPAAAAPRPPEAAGAAQQPEAGKWIPTRKSTEGDYAVFRLGAEGKSYEARVKRSRRSGKFEIMGISSGREQPLSIMSDEYKRLEELLQPEIEALGGAAGTEGVGEGAPATEAPEAVRGVKKGKRGDTHIYYGPVTKTFTKVVAGNVSAKEGSAAFGGGQIPPEAEGIVRAVTGSRPEGGIGAGQRVVRPQPETRKAREQERASARRGQEAETMRTVDVKSWNIEWGTPRKIVGKESYQFTVPCPVPFGGAVRVRLNVDGTLERVFASAHRGFNKTVSEADYASMRTKLESRIKEEIGKSAAHDELMDRIKKAAEAGEEPKKTKKKREKGGSTGSYAPPVLKSVKIVGGRGDIIDREAELEDGTRVKYSTQGYKIIGNIEEI